MTKQEFLYFCEKTYGTTPDLPFSNDFITTTLRHEDNKKWYALVMLLSRKKFGVDSEEKIDVVNLKLPLELFGAFTKEEGVYPAYHMNKKHWVSVLLPDAPDEVVKFLVGASFNATKKK